MAGQGVNAYTNNGGIWIGSDGPNTFTFMNDATTTAASLMSVQPSSPPEADRHPVLTTPALLRRPGPASSSGPSRQATTKPPS